MGLADWVEANHPRDERGRFGSGGGGKVSALARARAATERPVPALARFVARRGEFLAKKEEELRPSERGAAKREGRWAEHAALLRQAAVDSRNSGRDLTARRLEKRAESADARSHGYARDPEGRAFDAGERAIDASREARRTGTPEAHERAAGLHREAASWMRGLTARADQSDVRKLNELGAAERDHRRAAAEHSARARELRAASPRG